jgi:hypothetical protein
MRNVVSFEPEDVDPSCGEVVRCGASHSSNTDDEYVVIDLALRIRVTHDTASEDARLKSAVYQSFIASHRRLGNEVGIGALAPCMQHGA